MLIFDQYMEKLIRWSASESTISNHQRTRALFEAAGIDPMTAEDWQIEEWIYGLKTSRGKDFAVKTKQLHFENLAAVYNYAVRRGQLPVAPTEFVRKPTEADKPPRIITNADLRTILRSAQSDQDLLLAYLLVYTGMRLNEVRTLEWENVKPAENTITVVNGKGGKLRHVPVHPHLGEVLASIKPSGTTLIHHFAYDSPLETSSMTFRLERISSGVDCTFHDFRRTVATSLAEHAVPERVIDEIMGWSARTVGNRYYIRIAPHEAQEAILRLYSSDPLMK